MQQLSDAREYLRPKASLLFCVTRNFVKLCDALCVTLSRAVTSSHHAVFPLHRHARQTCQITAFWLLASLCSTLFYNPALPDRYFAAHCGTL